MSLETEVREIFDAPPVEKVFPPELKEALKAKLDGKITLVELDIICAKYTMTHCLRDYSRVLRPPVPPSGYDRYMNYTQKLKENGEMMNPHEHQRAVKEFTSYWEQVERVHEENITNAEWILFCRETLRYVDAPLAIKADEVLKGFIERGYTLGKEVVGCFLKSDEHPQGQYFRREA